MALGGQASAAGLSPAPGRRRAVVLLSGGLDSSTCLAIAQSEGYEAHAISFDYGQRHRIELQFAAAVAKRLGAASHRVVQIDLRAMGGSALTSDLSVPKHRSIQEMDQSVPITYVPARNTIFLSYALGLAEVLEAQDLFIGVNALDYSGYPDCRPDFIAAFETMANLATKASTEDGRRLTVHTPLMTLNKAQIVRKARSLGLDLSETLSCYDPSPAGVPCGSCDACLLREKGIREADLA